MRLLAIAILTIATAFILQTYDIHTLKRALHLKDAELVEVREMASAALAKIDRTQADAARHAQVTNMNFKLPAQIFEEAQFAVAITAIDQTPGLLQIRPSNYAAGMVAKINGQLCVITARHVVANKPMHRYFAHFKPDHTCTAINPEEIVAINSCQDHDIAVMRFARADFVFPWTPAEFALSRELKNGHILSLSFNELTLPTALNYETRFVMPAKAGIQFKLTNKYLILSISIGSQIG